MGFPSNFEQQLLQFSFRSPGRQRRFFWSLKAPLFGPNGRHEEKPDIPRLKQWYLPWYLPLSFNTTFLYVSGKSQHQPDVKTWCQDSLGNGPSDKKQNKLTKQSKQHTYLWWWNSSFYRTHNMRLIGTPTFVLFISCSWAVHVPFIYCSFTIHLLPFGYFSSGHYLLFISIHLLRRKV
jgi:hypothetical protein